MPGTFNLLMDLLQLINMKSTLLAILLFISAIATAQRISTPQGAQLSFCPGTTITQTSAATEFFRDTIKANTLMPNRYYPFTLVCSLTTPLIGIPGLTITIKYGSQTFSLMSSTALVGGVTGGLFTIEGAMVAKTSGTQFIYAKLMQPNGSLLTLGSSVTPTGNFTVDATQSQPFVITAQFTGVSLGTSSLTNQWMFRDAY